MSRIIAVDASVLSSKIVLNTGIYYCLVNYIEQLERHKSATDRILVFVPQFISKNWSAMFPKVEIISINFPLGHVLLRVIYQNFFLPCSLYRKRVSIYFNPSVVVPILYFRKSIVVIHDLTFKLYPQFYKSRFHNLYLEIMTNIATKRAFKIFCVSESTRTDVIRSYHVSPSKVLTVYNGLVQHQRSIPTIDKFSNKNVDNFSILFIGTFESKKNIPCLLEALAILLKRGFTNIKLKLVGKDGWGCEAIYSIIKEKQLIEYIEINKSASDEVIIQSYQESDVLVLPSIYEGFGLTILEAMANSVPVIASNVASIPEVVGKAGLLFESGNPEDLANKIAEIITNPEMSENLIKLGYDNLRRFSWDIFGTAFFKEINENPTHI